MPNNGLKEFMDATDRRKKRVILEKLYRAFDCIRKFRFQSQPADYFQNLLYTDVANDFRREALKVFLKLRGESKSLIKGKYPFVFRLLQTDVKNWKIADLKKLRDLQEKYGISAIDIQNDNDISNIQHIEKAYIEKAKNKLGEARRNLSSVIYYLQLTSHENKYTNQLNRIIKQIANIHAKLMWR